MTPTPETLALAVDGAIGLTYSRIALLELTGMGDRL
jgi:hypothetical protein